jgi:hypothetical protein
MLHHWGYALSPGFRREPAGADAVGASQASELDAPQPSEGAAETETESQMELQGEALYNCSHGNELLLWS